ncbi:MAG: ABC transporter permease, partial [Ferruginibacter sp.]
MASNVKESIALSWANVKSNKLRTIITVIIMALGIFALILIITAIRAASNSLTDSFSTMGSNTFGIRYNARFMRFGNNRGGNVQKKTPERQKKSNIGIPISFTEAKEFKNRYTFPGTVTSIALMGASEIVASYNNKKTNPDINIFGADENYVDLNGYSVATGRNFTPVEVNSGSSVCILGSSVAEKLFAGNANKAIDKVVNVDHRPYKVIAVLKDKGSSAFFNTGRVVLLPLTNVRRYYSTSRSSYS